MRRSLTLFVIAAAAAFATVSPVIADDVFDARGLSRYRTTFNELPFEHIDPLTGNLLLSFTDLVLPGNAGFDLRIQRTYNSKIHRDYNLQATALREDSWAGIGWTLHLGRVFFGSNLDTANPIIEMPDGSLHPTYRHIAPLAGCTPCFITKDYWVYDKNLGTLRMANGVVYTFNHTGSGGPAASGARYATRIEDPYGNVVTASYRIATPTDALTQIVQTIGAQTRTVNFSVGADGSLSSMTYNGRTWSYTQTSTTQFQQTLLTRADPPTGPSWQYDYNTSGTVPFELRQVTTPYGGTISYTYRDQNYNIGTTYTVRARVVGTRAVSGRDITSGSWTYTYATGSGNAQTVVSGPCNAYTYTFSGVGTSATPGNAWRVGLMTRMQNGVDTVTTTWTASEPISNDDEIIGFNTDFSTIVPLVAQRTVSRDGSSYTTTNSYSASSFNNYGRPTTITESGQATRTTSRTYTYSFGPYIRDKVASESVTVSGQTFSKSWGYQSDGFMTSETIYGVQTTFNDDAYGNVASMTNARGYTTYFDYSWGTVSRIQTPEHTTTRTINSDGTIASESRNGYSWSYGYDSLGRLTSENPPAGASTTLSYSASTISRSRLAWRLTEDLDGFGRPSGTTDAEGVKTDVDYDACGRVDYRSLPYTSTNTGTSFSLDGIGRVTRADHPGNDETFGYLSGNSVRRTDENGRITTYGYRSFGDPNERWLMSVSAGGVTTSYSRNAVGSLTLVSGTATGTRSFGYNSNNQLTSETHPESGQTTYGRDAVGNMTSRTDANTDLTSYTYDGNDRLRTINAPGTDYDSTLTYDDADNRRTIANGVASLSFSYDGANRLTRRSQTVGGSSLVTDFGLDSDGNVTSIDYPSGGRVTYGVDAMGRVTSVTRGATSLASLMSHHPSGNIASFRSGDGTTHTLSYDARHRPIGTVTSAGLNISYTRDDGGNVTSIADGRPGFSSGLGYDSLDRITSITGFGATSFTYSDSGNRLTKSNPGITYNYNASSRLSSTSGPPAETATYTYDNAGNQMSHGGSTFTYTPMNMMATATVSGTTSTYRYDGDERRVLRIAGGRTLRTVHGRAGELLGEFDVTGGTVRWVRDYVYAGARLIASASCDIVPSPATMSFTQSSGSQTLSVSAQGNCAWQPQSNQAWLTVSSTAEVLGAGSITVTAAANDTGTTRTATLRLSDTKSVQVSQQAGACTFAISPTSFAASPGGQSGSLAVTTLTGCAWTATTSQPSWVSFPSGSSGTGSGALAFTVAANTTTSARTATVTVGGLAMSISQAGAACTPSASPTNLPQFSGNNGGSSTVTVNAVTGCSWTGTSPQSWVTLQTGAGAAGASVSGTGGAAVTVAAQPNLTFAARSATLTIANTAVTVSQSAYSCGYSLSTANPTVPKSGGSADVVVTTGGICTWTATGLPAWATASIVSGVGTGTVNGTGTGTLRFSVASVGPDSGRSQTVNVAGQNIVLSQAGVPCVYTGTPASTGWLSPAGATGTVDIVGTVTCLPGVTPTPPAGMTITSTTPLPAGVRVNYSVVANTTTLPRSGSITMAGQVVHTVYQLGTSQPLQAIESPVANSLFQSGAITVTGYALDRAAQVGTGVDLVHVFVDGVDQGPATYGLYHAGAAAQIAAGQLPANFLYVGYSKTLALAAGRHTITVWARSVVSGAPNSASVFPIDVNGQPNVAVTAPANGAVVQAGQSVTMTAAASDPDGDAIARVEYYANGAFIGQATAAPYALTVTSVAGTYSVVARAVDARGGVRDSAASTLYVNAPPSVVMTSPPSGTTVLLGQTLTFGASVSDPEGNPATVVYEANGGAISSAIAAPYTFSAPAAVVGSFSITARATDSRGGVAVSAPIVVNVQVPTAVAFTSPPNGTTYAVGQPITVVVSASDPDGVNRVEFSYNGGIPSGTVTAPPYQLGLPGGAPAGTYVLVARMVDNLGNAVNSAPLTIYVTGSFVRHDAPNDGERPTGPSGEGRHPDRGPAEPAGAWWLALLQARADGVRAGRRVRARVRRWTKRLRASRTHARRIVTACLLLLGLAAEAQAQVKIEYFHLDPIGSVRMVTDSAGAVVERYDYHPFGEEVPPVTSGQTRRYAGKERDTETSYDYFGGRYYAGRVGRFTTADPAYVLDDNLLDPQRWNRYAYARNNPFVYSDPDGRVINLFVGAAIGATTGFVGALAAQTYRGGPYVWTDVLAASAGGAVSGGLAGLTLGGTLLGQAGVGAIVGVSAVTNVIGGAVGRALDSSSQTRPMDAGEGAIDFVVGAIGGRVGAQVAGAYAPRIRSLEAQAAAMRRSARGGGRGSFGAAQGATGAAKAAAGARTTADVASTVAGAHVTDIVVPVSRQVSQQKRQ